jgi:enoyl-CoA hydratase/carnithine racemase
VHGPACGSGFALALAADVRIAGTSAQMNDAFIAMGVSGCELGLSYFLPRLVGPSVAAELLYTNRVIDADRALATGLVSAVVPDDVLDAAGRALVDDMLRATPVALRASKAMLRRAIDLDDLAAVMDLEAETQAACRSSAQQEDAARGYVERFVPSGPDVGEPVPGVEQ